MMTLNIKEKTYVEMEPNEETVLQKLFDKFSHVGFIEKGNLQVTYPITFDSIAYIFSGNGEYTIKTVLNHLVGDSKESSTGVVHWGSWGIIRWYTQKGILYQVIKEG